MENDPILLHMGEVLRSARQEQGLTQRQLAELSGTTEQYISETECGKRNISYRVLHRILQALKIPTDPLFYEQVASKNGTASTLENIINSFDEEDRQIVWDTILIFLSGYKRKLSHKHADEEHQKIMQEAEGH